MIVRVGRSRFDSEATLTVPGSSWRIKSLMNVNSDVTICLLNFETIWSGGPWLLAQVLTECPPCW
jgi:hypothetical protein